MELAEAGPYLVAVAALIAASAFFSGTEVAMFSLRAVDKEQLARSDRRVDKLILSQLSRPDRLIATILLGNEVVNVSLSATLAGLMEGFLSGYGEIEIALLTTFFALALLLFLGEITPKTIAIKTSRSWAARAARPLWIFGTVVSPVRTVVRSISNGILRVFGFSKEAPEENVGEDEFKALVDVGSAQGEVDAHERQLIHKVFEFSDKAVADVMLPRDKIFALSYDVPASRLVREVAARGFSRVPIFQRSLDNVRGILYAKDLVIQGAVLRRGLADMLHRPLFVPQTIRVATLFRIFKQRKIHLALVVNEYGKVAGLVTMEDVLEELFGDIRDEREERQSVKLPRLPSQLALLDEAEEEAQ
jgi:CBS domain containing-hemolysin-like protein